MKCKVKHLDPVHFNMAKGGNIWVCLKCGNQIAGPLRSFDEITALIVIVESIRKTQKKK